MVSWSGGGAGLAIPLSYLTRPPPLRQAGEAALLAVTAMVLAARQSSSPWLGSLGSSLPVLLPPLAMAAERGTSAAAAAAGAILPLPFLPYRRVKIQGRGRVRIQVHV